MSEDARGVPTGLIGTGALLLTLVGVLLWVSMLSGPVRLASGMLGARSHLTKAQNALSNGAFKKAVLETFTAQADAERARAGLEADSPLMDLATISGAVDDTMREVPHLLGALSHSADAASGTLDIGLNALRGPDRVIVKDSEGEGSIISIPRIEDIGDIVAAVRGDVAAARADLEAINVDNLPRRLRDDIPQAITQTTETDALLAKAQDGIALLPAILGANGRRTYLIGFMNSAELRGTGGAMLQIRCISFIDGRPILPRRGEDLPSGVPDCKGTIYNVDRNRKLQDIPLPDDAFYVREIDDAQRFGNANWSPDWPLSAKLTLAYGKASDPAFPDFDGVIGLDPVTIQELMGGIGPFRIEAGNRLTRTSVLNFLLSKAYTSYPEAPKRRVVLNQVVELFFDRMFDPLHPSQLVSGIGGALADKHMQIWMRDSNEEAFVSRMKWDGALKTAKKSDYFDVVEQNVGGNKLDYTALQTDTMDIALDGTDALVKAEVSIYNGMALPQPRWVLGDSKSAHRPMINVYVPTSAELLGADAGPTCSPSERNCNGRLDTPAPAIWSGGRPGENTEANKRVWSATLQIPPSQQGSFALSYRVPGVVIDRGSRSTYRLVVQHQPKVRPQRLLIRLTVPDGARGLRAPGFERDGGALIYDHLLTTDTILEVSWQS